MTKKWAPRAATLKTVVSGMGCPFLGPRFEDLTFGAKVAVSR